MEFSPASQPYKIEPYEPLPLTTEQVKDVVCAYEQGERLPSNITEQFLETPPEEGALDRIGKRMAALPTALLAGHIATETMVELQGDDLPTLGHLSKTVHTALNNTYEILPVGSQVVNDPIVMEHLPQALLAGAISTTVAGIFVSTVGAIRERRMRHRIEAAQDDIRQQMADGTIRWSIPQDSTVAVIGNGDPFVRNLARKYPDQVLPVSYTATDGAWTHLPKEADHAQTLQALDRADLEHAGQLMVFPITPSQEFLPGPDDYDISVERVVYYIQTSDEFCDRKGIPRKPVMVIGHGEQAECYQTASYSNDNALAEELCLEQRLQQLSEERGCEVILVDPNEIVMDKIVQIADGRKPVLAGTAASVKQYAERFFGALYGRIDVTGDTDPVRVLYNKNDIATVTLARQGDITVVLDPRERPALEWKGIPPEHIVVPAEEVLGVVAPTLEELQELRARSRSV